MSKYQKCDNCGRKTKQVEISTDEGFCHCGHCGAFYGRDFSLMLKGFTWRDRLKEKVLDRFKKVKEQP